MVLFLGIVTINTMEGLLRPVSYMFFAVAAIFVAAPWVAKRSTKNITKKIYNNLEDYSTTLEVTPECLILTRSIGQRRLPWKTLKDVVIAKDYIYLEQSEGAVIIPHHAFADEIMMDEFIEKVKEHIQGLSHFSSNSGGILMRIDFELTGEDYLATSEHFHPAKPDTGTLIFRLMLPALVIGGAILLQIYQKLDWDIALFLLGAALLWYYISPWLLEKKIGQELKKTFSAVPAKTMLLAIKPAGILVTESDEERELKWQGFKELEETPDYIFIKGPEQMLTIPLRAFAGDEEKKDRFIALVKGYIAET